MQSPMRPLDSLGTLIIFGLCVSWGLNQVAPKVALADIPPMTQAALRSVGATLVLGAVGIWREPTLFDRDRTLPAGILGGVCFAPDRMTRVAGAPKVTPNGCEAAAFSAGLFTAVAVRVYRLEATMKLPVSPV